MIEENLTKAWQLFDIGKWASAEEIYLECYEQIDVSDHEHYEAVLMGLIYVESYMEKYDEARNYAKLLLEVARDEEARHIALHQTGMIERMAGEYENAMALFLLEAEVIAEAFPEDDLRIATNLYEQGYCHMKMCEMDLAEEKMQLALAYAIKSEDGICIGCAYRGLGEIMKTCRKPEQAKNYFNQAIEAFEAAGDSIAVDEVRAMS